MNHRHARAIFKTFLMLCAVIAFCGGARADQPPRHQVVDRVRAEVARVLKRNASQIDVAKPLSASGADELDVVEIVLAIEQAFKIVIPDSALGENPSKTLTVQQLAEIALKHFK
jgi:acyl carrier protein